MNAKIPPVQKLLVALGRQARESGLKAWVVGGFVRDRYLGKKTCDIDICVQGSTKTLIDFCVKIYGAEAFHFNDFGTARVTFANGLKLDFVTCRREVYVKPAALPQVKPSNLADDLYRRDFTANAWALSLLPGEFMKSCDLFQSRLAIDKKTVKILHPKSFKDDPTRIFRALRFSARFGWKLESGTQKLLKVAVKGNFISLLSRERIRQELVKILEERAPLDCFRLMDKYGVTRFIYKGLKYPPAAAKVKDLRGLLTLLALTLGGRGGDFLKSLRLERGLYNECAAVVDFYNNKKALARPLSAAQRKLVKLYSPKILPYALRPLVIGGADLQKQGLSGPAISAALARVARLQFAGKIKTKKQAFDMLLPLSVRRD
jgi:tRNA nucleotidyltransferase/poly(A) polymerase